MDGRNTDGPDAEVGGAVPYLSGRGGGETFAPDGAIDEWRATLLALRGRIDQLLAEGERVERAFEDVKFALDRSQPPMWKRVAVRWWRLRGGGPRTPVLIRVESGPNNREKPVRVERPGIVLRRDRGFGLCADLAKRGVAAYWGLWAIRSELQAEVVRVKKSLGRRVEKRQRDVDRIVAEARMIRSEAEGRLQMVGYVVPGAEVAEVDPE